jgi:hypothetical protein
MNKFNEIATSEHRYLVGMHPLSRWYQRLGSHSENIMTSEIKVSKQRYLAGAVVLER